MDNLDNKKWQEIPAIFLCEYCDYKTSRKSHYDKHLSTPKHQRIILDNGKFPEKNLSYDCLCGKKYKHLSGLCKHRKKCVKPNMQHEFHPDFDFKSVFLDMVKQNDEFKQLIMNQTKCILEQNTKLAEIASSQNITNNTSISNTMNNKFNLLFAPKNPPPLILMIYRKIC